MDVQTIELFLASNTDLHDIQPVNDPNGMPVDMTGWPFKLELKFDELDAAPALTVGVTVSASGELTLDAGKAAILALLPANSKKKLLVGDLLTRPNNGAYVARLARVAVTVERGVSTL